MADDLIEVMDDRMWTLIWGQKHATTPSFHMVSEARLTHTPHSAEVSVVCIHTRSPSPISMLMVPCSAKVSFIRIHTRSTVPNSL